MYGIDAGMGGLKKVAAKKASKKKSKTSKIGDMLDRLEMQNAPRRPFMSKIKGAKPAPKKKSIIPRSPTN